MAALSAAILIALACFAPALISDFDIPLMYSSDALSHAFIVKSIIEGGVGFLSNASVGAPFGGQLYDYPMDDGLHFLVIEVLSMFSHDWAIVFNLFFLFTIFAAAFVAFAVLLTLEIGAPWAMVGALLFAFMPYHFYQVVHIFLAGYYTIPLAIWMALLIWDSPGGPAAPSAPRRPSNLLVLIALLALGSCGIYYAAFSMALILVAATAAAVQDHSWRKLRLGLAAVAAVLVVVAVNLMPSLAYRIEHGPNIALAHDQPAHSELYGLKIIELLVPAQGHRWDKARKVSDSYADTAPLVNENRASSLGGIGSVGLMLLLGACFMRLAGAGGEMKLIDKLGLLVIAAIFIGTVGGFGAVFAYTISPLLRGYNRISIFVAFLSITALMWMLHSISTRHRWRRSVVLALCTLLAIAGLWDQVAPFDRTEAKASFESDRAFFANADAAFAKGTMVYQLPYHPFPEAGPEVRMEDYGHLRAYLGSHTLRWSYGDMKGREGDTWKRTLGTRPIDRQLILAAQSGFGAVYVDRRGYADQGHAVEQAIQSASGKPLLTSADGNLAIYRLQATGTSPLPLSAIRPALSDVIDLRRPDSELAGVTLRGFSGAEPWGRWTDGNLAEIRFDDPLPLRFVLSLQLFQAFGPNASKPVRVRVGGSEQNFVPGPNQTTQLSFDTSLPAKTIEIFPAIPTSPTSIGVGVDGRRLGIGVVSIKIDAVP